MATSILKSLLLVFATTALFAQQAAQKNGTTTSNQPSVVSPAQTRTAPSTPAAKKAAPQKVYDVTGSWEHRATVSDGGAGALVESLTLQLQQVGSKITGTFLIPVVSSPVFPSLRSPPPILTPRTKPEVSRVRYVPLTVTGSIDGSRVVLTITRDGVNVVYDGNLVDAYTLKGTTRVPGGTAGSWNAKREVFNTTALHYAASAGQKDIVELLLDKGADVNAKDKNGETSLHYAARGGHKEIAELLLDKGADVNAKGKNGETPLHNAAEAGNREVAEILLAKGAAINAETALGDTPLRLAVSRENDFFLSRPGHKEVEELLRKHGGHE